MPLAPRSSRLDELSWVDVQARLERDTRLIVPIGTCDQYGPHLPLGAGTLIAEAVADELSRDFDVLRAPTIAYGVNLPTEAVYPGTAGLQEKSLHRALNDLLASWETNGFTEFILITAHRFDPHIDVLASATGSRARVRAVELLGINSSDLLEGGTGPEHGGEVMTSLLLHLYPARVRMDRAADHALDARTEARRRRLTRLPPDCPGSVGQPSLASAEKGRRIFELMLQRVRARVFLQPEDEEP